jgi:hypothetical protein
MISTSPASAAVAVAAAQAKDDGFLAVAAASLRALALRIKGADDIRQDVLDIASELAGDR